MTTTAKPSQRLVGSGNADTAPGIAPSNVNKSDAVTATSRSRFGTTPSDVITPSGDFTPRDGDVRPHSIQVITLASFGGTDSFKLQYAGGSKTAALVRGTNAAASDLQSELRTLTGDTALTVTLDTTDVQFTVRFSGQKLTRRGPGVLAVTDGSGCTGTVADGLYTEDLTGGPGVQGATLGESIVGDRLNTAPTTRHVSSFADVVLTPPIIGTITATDGIDQVDSFSLSSGTDGGTFEFAYGPASTGAIDPFTTNLVAIQALVDNVWRLSAEQSVDAPAVALHAGMEVATIDFGDMNTADTCKLTYDSVEGTTVITYSASMTAATIQAAVDELIGANEAVVARTSNLVYTVTKQTFGAFASTFTVTSTATFTPLGSGGYTAGGKITTADDPTGYVYYIDYGGSTMAGRPVAVGYGLRVQSDALLDGVTAEPGTLAQVTAGVLGSLSAAYTEMTTYGISVLCSAVHRTSGKGYTAQLDAGTPAVFTGLVPGVYDVIARTATTNGRVSRASVSSQTVASS